MIVIRNTQRTILLPIKDLYNDALCILELLGYDTYDLGIWFTNNRNIRRYNKQYRQINKPTDVLSFPYYPALKAGERIKPTSDEESILGDLIISAEYVAQAAISLNVTFEEQLRLILVHGILHLLGYDHIKDADYKQMRAKELYILEKLQQNSQKISTP